MGFRNLELCKQCGGLCCRLYALERWPRNRDLGSWLNWMHEDENEYGVEPLFNPLQVFHPGNEHLRQELRVSGELDAGIAGALGQALGQEWRAALYIAGSLFIAWHLYRGIQSMARSLGFHHPRYTVAIERAGAALAVLLGLGFASIPVWILVSKGG